jgi:acetyl-CoA acetyltransferase
MVQLSEVAVAGAGLTRYDIYDGSKGRPFKECDELGTQAILAALKESQFSINDIQAAFCGKMYASTATGHNAISRIGRTGMPIVNLENACSSGGSAIRLAFEAIAREQYDVVLAFGAEEAPPGGHDQKHQLAHARTPDGVQRAAGLLCHGAVRYMEEAAPPKRIFHS